MKAQAGVGRVEITPFWGVELTGWGYYLERTWRDIHDPLFATALVAGNEHDSVAVVSLDLMVIGTEFTKEVRRRITAATGIPPRNILVCCQHTHNAPASGGLLGVGEVDPLYEQWAARQAATAAILAWRTRAPATFSAATAQVTDLTFNRTRPDGPIDPHLTALRVDRNDGTPLAVVVGFQGHPTIATVLRPWSVSRDLPGEVCDGIEQTLPGCTAMYIQGACGDVNFHREFSSEERCREPGRILLSATLAALERRETLNADRIEARSRMVRLPTRRWTPEEIEADRHEAERRLRDSDVTGWRETIGRVMTNNPADMVARHGGNEWKAVAAMCRFNLEWTTRMLADYQDRPEWIETEVQALRIGEFGIVANSSEFFSGPALEVRRGVQVPYLMHACYANGRIGYLPDPYDVERKTYASYQSPKYCDQFPFTAEASGVMVQAMKDLMNLSAADSTG